MNLIVSKYFPGTEAPTKFVEKIRCGDKIHTIRANYDYWIKHDGKEVYICTWTDKPYRSKIKKHFVRKIVVEKIDFHGLLFSKLGITIENINFKYELSHAFFYKLIKNDGLAPWQFIKWFEGYDLNKPMAIVHFTDFRYAGGK